MFVKADICFSAALALSFFEVDFDLILSPKVVDCFGVTADVDEADGEEVEEEEEEEAGAGVTFGVEGKIEEEEGLIFGEGGCG